MVTNIYISWCFIPGRKKHNMPEYNSAVAKALSGRHACCVLTTLRSPRFTLDEIETHTCTYRLR